VALLVMRCLPGAPSPSVNHPAFVAAGHQLRRVHSITVHGFGPLRVDAAGSVLGEHSGWEEFTETAHTCIAELVAHRIMDVPFADDVRRALGPQHDAMRYDGPPVLLHGDLHPRHIFADEAGLTGVIDWGDVMAGDPYFDLARYSIGGQDSLADLLTGYGAVMSPDLDRRFTLYRMIRMTRTLHDELRAGGDWFEAYRQQLRADLRLLRSLY
ncbi:MAG: phosphotransferase family protein, partial [Mycobacterium sp.]